MHRVKRRHVAAATAALALGAAAVLTMPGACDAGLWQHVYNPSRLVVQHEACITVTGTIADIRHEADGDDHIRLTLDAGQEHFLNQRNVDAQHGDLVVEPVCLGVVTQSDAQDACRGYASSIHVPAIGTHIRATGSYVLDTSPNHGWMEVHPVTTLTASP